MKIRLPDSLKIPLFLQWWKPSLDPEKHRNQVIEYLRKANFTIRKEYANGRKEEILHPEIIASLLEQLAERKGAIDVSSRIKYRKTAREFGIWISFCVPNRTIRTDFLAKVIKEKDGGARIPFER